MYSQLFPITLAGEEGSIYSSLIMELCVASMTVVDIKVMESAAKLEGPGCLGGSVG